ncbi:hypothetical protein GCM10009846_01720 [Agrococcus versicolor]|uniref:Uncharacterized protein n=1 Tax=Agrococcus versicolor TaxID=501482 RepID=A0ABP5MC41_9MICO
MKTRTVRFSREHYYSLDIEEETGRRVLSIPVTFGAIDSEERYALSDELFARLVEDEAAAQAFADECRAHAHDDLLVTELGWRRGSPIEPSPAGTMLPPAPAPASAPVEGAQAIRGDEPPASVWFGPDPSGGPERVASPHRAAAAPLDERVASVASAAREGDLSGRTALVDLLHDSSPDGPSMQARLQAQRLLVSLARDEDIAEPTTFRYLDDAPMALVEAFAGSGRLLQARSATDALVRVGRAHWREPDVRRGLISSLLVLVHRQEDRRVEPTLVNLAKAAVTTLAEQPAAYLLKSGPWSPSEQIGRMRSSAERCHAQGSLFGNWFLAPDLALWSGIPGPYLKDVLLSDDDLAAVLAWADALDALAWVPGRKYFHGHDVDGGPSLR